SSALDPDTLPVLGATTVGFLGTPLGQGHFLVAYAFGPRRTVQLWNAATGQAIGPLLHLPVHTFPGSVSAVAYSGDGKGIVTGHGSVAGMWDAATGELIGKPIEQGGLVTAVAFSPDGKAILTGSNDDTARLWDTATGRQVGFPLKHRSTVTSVAFSPDGAM